MKDLQASVQDKTAFQKLDDYLVITQAFLKYLAESKPTKIVSPSRPNYIFYQYGEDFAHKITRPLNADLFILSEKDFVIAFAKFKQFLKDLGKHEASITGIKRYEKYLDSNEINQVIYTAQQSIGCIGDSFKDPNQCRKRIGQLFEQIISLVVQEIGVNCANRRIKVPIPDTDLAMPYELDIVFSRDKSVDDSKIELIYPHEIVGSIKTTSKDRIDKVFLDKYLLTRFLDRPVPVVAIFLHDVQRAVHGESIFGINSTFKSNHFLCYSVALNKLNGVYYIDPLPEMLTDRFNKYISSFKEFLIHDIWVFLS